LLHVLFQRLGVVAGKSRADGVVSVDQTSCIGMCDHSAGVREGSASRVFVAYTRL
jgi:[NiFe] hydrogenase diaphorase moiety large subunit